MTGRKDISNEVALEGGGNPFGWSSYEIMYQGQSIGEMYCGFPKNFKDGYSFEIKQESDNVKRCIIYKNEIELVPPQ